MANGIGFPIGFPIGSEPFSFNGGIGGSLGGTGGAPPFSPTDIPDLALWLDASDASTITEVAGLVSQWNDKSGLGNNATQPTVGQRPTTGTRTLNGKNVIDFDGVLNNFILPSGLYGIPAGANTIFMVVNLDVQKDQFLIRGEVSGGNSYGIWANNTTAMQVVNSAGTFVNAASVLAATTTYIVGFYRSGASITPVINGVDSTSGSAANRTLTGLILGALAFGNRNMDGVIAETVIYSRALTTGERDQVGSYLAAKWGGTWS